MKTIMPVMVGAAVVGTALAGGVGTAQAAPVRPAAASSTVLSATDVRQPMPAWPVLSRGQNRTWPRVTVRSLQYLLNARGARLSVDGVFGSKTQAAVRAFQRAHRLPVTGVVVAGTWRSLIVTVRIGSVGPAVCAVQDQINFRNLKDGHTLAVDGIFGAKTKAAVRGFQQGMALQVHGFPVNGIVGAQTWQALVSEALSG